MKSWLNIMGMTCEDTSTCNWAAAGINLDDDQCNTGLSFVSKRV
jgi:hypothetical protein